jgi:hypothetical protein
MIHKKWLVLDRYCEVYDLLAPYADSYFWHFEYWDPVPNSIVVLDGHCRSKCHLSLREFVEKIKETIHRRPDLTFVFCKSSEGSETLEWHIPVLGLGHEAISKKMLVIGGAEMDTRFACLSHEKFLERVWELEENKQNLTTINQIFTKKNKPYKFLFLSGRAREHRKFLQEKLTLENLLDSSLFSNLDLTTFSERGLRLYHNDYDHMEIPRPIKYLPEQYELPKVKNRIKDNTNADFVKYHLFDGEWLDGVINPACYIDTYFSVVTETAFHYPYSFRTEKIWKAVMVGHPWIAVSNKGFYRDFKNLGFKTFGNIIDERFDEIDNGQERIERVSQVIIDLCKQDLDSFLDAVKEVCYYNQKHMENVYLKSQKEFPQRFIDFVGKYMRKDC